MKKVREFLAEGNKVKVTVMFRGREVTIPQEGLDQLQKMVDHLTAEAKVESPPKREGRTMFMMLAPVVKSVGK